MESQGQRDPIKVRPISDDIVEIIDGHRRLEAARLIEWEDIAAIVEEMSDADALVAAGVSNIAREDMTPLDTARWLRDIKAAKGWNNEDLERHGIMNHSGISRFLALLEQPEEIKEMLENRANGPTIIRESHVREARRVLDTDQDKIAVLRKAQAENLSAANTRRVAESIAVAPSEQAKEALLKRTFNRATHDPKRIERRAKIHGAHDAYYRTDESYIRKDEVWKTSPAVIEVIDYVKQWGSQLSDCQDAIETGKLSPEARRFVAAKMQEFNQRITETIEELNNG